MLRVSGCLGWLYRSNRPSWRTAIHIPANNTRSIGALTYSWPNCRVVSCVCVSLLLVLFHECCNLHDLFLSLYLVFSESTNKQFFSNKYALLINNIIKLSIFGVKHLFFFIIIIVLFIFVINVIFSFISVDTLSSVLVITILAIVVAIKLLKDVLDLSSKLFITLFH